MRVDRFLDLSDRDAVVEKVLEEWLLRELRDEIASRLTWKDPGRATAAASLRFSLDRSKPFDVFFLSPVGLGGRFFYERPVGEAFYSAECHVRVDVEQGPVRTNIALVRLFWVGSGDPRGYRVSEGFDELFGAIEKGVDGPRHRR